MNEKDYMKLIEFAEEIVQYSGYMVEKYGVQLANRSDTNKTNFHQRCYHDWIYFCFAKVSRSLYASVHLAKDLYRVDVLLILRSAYELCLKLSNTLKDPKRIQEYVFQETGLKHGTYNYTRRNGKINYQEVIYKETGVKYPHGTSVGKISKKTLNGLDGKLHSKIYGYFSEFMHSSMISSGDFLSMDLSKYTVNPQKYYFEIPFLVLYTEFMILECFEYYHTGNHNWNVMDIRKNELYDLYNLASECREHINELCEEIDFSQFGGGVKESVLRRVTPNFT